MNQICLALQGIETAGPKLLTSSSSSSMRATSLSPPSVLRVIRLSSVQAVVAVVAEVAAEGGSSSWDGDSMGETICCGGGVAPALILLGPLSAYNMEHVHVYHFTVGLVPDDLSSYMYSCKSQNI